MAEVGALVEQEKERLRGTNNPLSGATPGGLGEPCGGETRSGTTTNPTQPSSKGLIWRTATSATKSHLQACYKLYGSFKTF